MTITSQAGFPFPAAPATPVRPVTENLHGETITDPYRWLEGDDRGNPTPEVIAWTEAQNARTRACLDAVPGREGVERVLDRLYDLGEIDWPRRAAGRCFFLRRLGNQKQMILFVTDGRADAGRPILDPLRLDPDGLVAIAGFEPSPDGRLVACSLFRVGDEQGVLHFLDVQRGELLAETIPGKPGGVCWLPDSASFVYSRLADPTDPYSRRVCHHVLGTDPASDPVLLAQATSGALATTWGPFGRLGRDGRWLILGYHTSTRSNDLWVADFTAWRKTGRLEKRPILLDAKANLFGQPLADRLLLQSTWQTPRGSLVEVDPERPDPGHWRVRIPEDPTAVLEQVGVTRDDLVARYQKEAAAEIRLFSREGTFLRRLELPAPGTAEIEADEADNRLFIRYSSFHEPGAIFSVDLSEGSPGKNGGTSGESLAGRPPAGRPSAGRPSADARGGTGEEERAGQLPEGASAPQARLRQSTPLPEGMLRPWLRLARPEPEIRLTVTRDWAESADGTRVGFFVVHRADLDRATPHPTVLYGYGGFSHGLTPAFHSGFWPWLTAGGIFVVANLRGGNEFGEEWHRAGMLEQKERVYEDCAAVARRLIALRVTEAAHLGFYGRSNGGLLAGVMAVRHPELFRAIISEVPLLDMLRYQHFLMARYWVPEYGSAEDPVQFRWLRPGSPYHNVRPGVAYPAVLLTAGENDTRVHPLHARKMAAALQAASPAGNEAPILLFIDREAGHGVGKPRHLRLREALDRLMFLFWRLGLAARVGLDGSGPGPVPDGPHGPKNHGRWSS